jgi:hypothetical protein
MTYNIALTNGNLFAVIPDGTINNQSSMTLIGRNYAGGYGEFQDENFIRLLESGANGSAPSAPLTGQLWYNTGSKTLQVYNGTTFKSLSGATAQATAPTSTAAGDLWFDTTNQQLKVWTGSAWLAVGPATSTGTGAVATTIADAANTQHSVIELNVNGNIVGIVSQSATFAPANAIAGFANIYPGITLSTGVNGQTPVLTGTATDATTFAGLPTTAFMSAVQDTQTRGKVQILNANGLFVGQNNELSANVVGNTTVNLYNNAINGNINFGINKNLDGKTTAIRVVGATGNVIIPGNLSVTGTITATTEILSTSQVIAGNISAANGTLTGNLTANNIVISGAYIGSGLGLGNIVGANVTGTVALAGNATVLKTAAWTVSQIGPNLVFQVAGNTVASLDPQGNFTTLGNITANSTP